MIDVAINRLKQAMSPEMMYAHDFMLVGETGETKENVWDLEKCFKESKALEGNVMKTRLL